MHVAEDNLFSENEKKMLPKNRKVTLRALVTSHGACDRKRMMPLLEGDHLILTSDLCIMPMKRMQHCSENN